MPVSREPGWEGWQAMGEIEIRQVLPGEYEDTGALTQRAYAEYARPGNPLWDRYFGVLADVAGRARFATVLVALAGGRIVGTATVELDRMIDGTGSLPPGQANLRLLAVDPQARGRGVGRRLVEACVQVARRAGKQVVTLYTTEQWRPRSVSTGRWASAAICLATSSCIPIWCSRPSGFRSGHRADKAPITAAIYDPKRRAAIRPAAG
jgi:GNAT superfamily N-acetyltransferase